MKNKLIKLLTIVLTLAVLLSLVACEDATVTGIEIASPPHNTVYLTGETFDSAGMVVNKIMSDKTKQPATATEYTVSPSTALTIDVTEVTVTCGEFSATVDIEVVNATEIQLVAVPTKTIYVAGESFDATGMVIKALLSNGDRGEITDYTVDKTTLALEDTFVTVTWKTFSVKVNVTVVADVPTRTVTDVEIYGGEDLIYTRTMDVSSVVKYKAVYSDGTKDADWTYALAEDLNSYKVEGNNLVVNISLFVKNVEFVKEVTIPVSNDFVTIGELLKTTPNNEEVQLVKGIVVAVASTMSRPEYILYDTVSGKFIGVSGVPATGNMFTNTYVPTYNIGDEICIPVKLIKTDVKDKNSDSEKVYAQYAGGSIYDTAITVADATYTIDKSSATQITSQAGLQAVLGADNRPDNHYSMVKFNGPLNYISYGTSPVHYRFSYPGVTSLNAQKVDEASPVLMNANQLYITGNTVGDLLVGDDNWSTTNWANPDTIHKDIYALFIGGNAYYHEFIILSVDDVEIIPQVIVKQEFVSPNKDIYVVGEDFDIAGATITRTHDYGDDRNIVVTMDMLDATTIPDMTVAGTYVVKGSHEGFDFTFAVKVSQESASEINLIGELTPSAFNLTFGTDSVISKLLEMSFTAKFATEPDEVVVITEKMISFANNWYVGANSVVVTYLGAKLTIDITVVDDSMSVTNIKTQAAGTTKYSLRGIVVSSAFIGGTAEAPAFGEIFVKDINNHNVIGVRNLGITTIDKLAGLTVGDEIIVKVTIGVASNTATHSEYGKLVALAVANQEVMVISKNNNAKIELDSAVSVGSVAEFTAFLQNSTVRKNNVYKMVKFEPGTRFVVYAGGLYITYGSTLAESKIDKLTPFMNVMNQSMTLGDTTYGDLFIGEGQALVGTFADPIILDKAVYMMYIGGQGIYYHQFILLGADYFGSVATAQEA